MRLIYAEELKEAYKSVYNKIWLEVNGIMSIVDDAQTIDAVPVIRCRDCKYSLPNDGKLNDGARYCSRIYGGAKKEHPAVWDVDYCSGGERKKVYDENT